MAAGYQRIDVPVSGPTGEPVMAAFAMRGDVAVVEAAQACGLSRLPGGRLRPLTATSYGVGELIGAAAGAGAPAHRAWGWAAAPLPTAAP